MRANRQGRWRELDIRDSTEVKLLGKRVRIVSWFAVHEIHGMWTQMVMARFDGSHKEY